MSRGRREVRCKVCGQHDVRYEGWRSLFNPRRPRECTFCGADLATGKLSAAYAVFHLRVAVSIYAMHALVGVGLAMLAIVFFPALSEHRWLTVALLCGGGLAGLAKAELNRRSGTLLHPKPKKPS